MINASNAPNLEWKQNNAEHLMQIKTEKMNIMDEQRFKDQTSAFHKGKQALNPLKTINQTQQVVHIILLPFHISLRQCQ